ncbi:hypothetical protein [Halorubrum sp. SD626R]|uniref:hypothetical protein n=1 Tax=Halorubrum sp. SD626R TaxID=1419722 RepID=UPI000B8736F5|nr:hypothetical protein [Halorubrum sp. SD626R]TKX77662.1 hypothetical protein EXE53_25390 [Halorubrum sp. SD626R]
MSSKPPSAPGVGHTGPLVSARCTGCGKCSKKRTAEIVGDESSGSFEHVCHSCRCVTWWNVLDLLEAAERSRGKR